MIINNLFERAKKVIPGGVNSPVRAFKAVNRDPLFIKSAKGSKIVDVHGHEYLDYVCSWGPMILGHNHPKILEEVSKTIQNGLSFGAPTENEVLLAELITDIVPNIEMIRMVNSGTEAVMSALRLARGYTRKDKIIKFEGCYHGHCDSMLVKAGSGALTFSTPDSLGITKEMAKDTLVAVYNDILSVEKLFMDNQGQIAGVIIEPVAANMGVVLPEPDFLNQLKKLCEQNAALLIFDEVITGFRLGIGGAGAYYHVQADLVTYGKIIGGGMPVGAYGGRREIMEFVSPLGGVYQAGTLSGNPIAMAAGLAQIKMLRENSGIYQKIECLAQKLADGFKMIAIDLNLPLCVNSVGSLVCVFFTGKAVRDFTGAKLSNTTQYAQYFNKMLEEGIYLAPSQFEAMFVSDAHTEEDIEKTLIAARKVFNQMKKENEI